jgi:hypothetical protein
MTNSTTGQEPVTGDWKEFTGFESSQVFPAVECYRHSAHNYFSGVINHKSQADNFPIPLAVLFARQERLNAVPSF